MTPQAALPRVASLTHTHTVPQGPVSPAGQVAYLGLLPHQQEGAQDPHQPQGAGTAAPPAACIQRAELCGGGVGHQGSAGRGNKRETVQDNEDTQAWMCSDARAALAMLHRDWQGHGRQSVVSELSRPAVSMQQAMRGCRPQHTCKAQLQSDPTLELWALSSIDKVVHALQVTIGQPREQEDMRDAPPQSYRVQIGVGLDSSNSMQSPGLIKDTFGYAGNTGEWAML